MNFERTWETKLVPDRVKLCRVLGFEGKMGSKAWKDIPDKARLVIMQALKKGGSYKRLYRKDDKGRLLPKPTRTGRKLRKNITGEQKASCIDIPEALKDSMPVRAGDREAELAAIDKWASDVGIQVLPPGIARGLETKQTKERIVHMGTRTKGKGYKATDVKMCKVCGFNNLLDAVDYNEKNHPRCNRCRADLVKPTIRDHKNYLTKLNELKQRKENQIMTKKVKKVKGSKKEAAKKTKTAKKTSTKQEESPNRYLVELFLENNKKKRTDQEIQEMVIKKFGKAKTVALHKLANVSRIRTRINKGKIAYAITDETIHRWEKIGKKRVKADNGNKKTVSAVPKKKKAEKPAPTKKKKAPPKKKPARRKKK